MSLAVSAAYSLGSLGALGRSSAKATQLHSWQFTNYPKEIGHAERDQEQQNCEPNGLRLTHIEIFVAFLQSLSLPGPLFFINDRECIGYGSQFTVCRQTMAWPRRAQLFTEEVAVKQPNFFLHHDNRLNLADTSTSKHIADMKVEIRALMHPELRSHANVARLLAWGVEGASWYSPPVLIMELAISDLHMLSKSKRLSDEQLFWICLDIGAALDAIHVCEPHGLIHGDLKPQNVLIFERHGRFMAKLADFGLSTASADAKQGVILGGTHGWLAPEVIQGQRLTQAGSVAADNYAFGLVIWRLLEIAGGNVALDQVSAVWEQALVDMLSTHTSLSPTRRDAYEQALRLLLHETPLSRPQIVANLLDDGSPSHIRWQNSVLREADSYHSFFDGEDLYDWEVPPLATELMEALSDRTLINADNFSGSLLFAMFLGSTNLTGQKESQTASLTCDILLNSALKGYEPAQKILVPTFQYLDRKLPIEQPILQDVLENAVSAGSRLAVRYLTNLNSAKIHTAVFEFLANGGYAPYYSAICFENRNLFGRHAPLASPTRNANGGESSLLQWLVVHGTLLQLQAHIRTCSVTEITSRTSAGFTLLHLACMRGDAEILFELLKYDHALSSVHGKQPSPLHWLFAFPPKIQTEVAKRLQLCGMSIDAHFPQPTPFPFYPFILPAGTPMHWAVAIQSHETISALIEIGANVLCRNGEDPYKHDDRLRILSEFGGPNMPTQYAYSQPVGKVMGLSPLDIAAKDHDPYIFECIADRTSKLDDGDEEGFCIAHRLSSDSIRHTSWGAPFCDRYFRGERDLQRRLAFETASVIARCGADLNQLTGVRLKTIALHDSKASEAGIMSGDTPLMLAMRRNDLNTVEALLEHGADANCQNDVSETASLCIDSGHRSSDQDTCCRFRALAKHGASLDHRARGMSALSHIAKANMMLTAEFLLSRGVDIGVFDNNSNTPGITGTHWLCELAFSGGGLDTKQDDGVVKLMEEFVFKHQDQTLARKILNDSDNEGGSLLHYFASREMLRSVRALVGYGVDLSRHRRDWTDRFRGATNVFGDWYQTPLDVARECKARHVREAENPSKRHSNREHAELLKKNEAIIDLLITAGARSANTMRKERGVCVCSDSTLCRDYYRPESRQG